MKWPRLTMVMAFASAMSVTSFAPAVADGALRPLPGTGDLKPSQTDQFTFLVGGDNRPRISTLPQPPIVAEVFSACAKLKPAFVLWSGDTIFGKDPANEDTIAREYKEFLQLAASGHTPVFNAPGNHEMDDITNQPNPTLQKWYAKYMSQPYAAFVYGNSAFIAMNTEEVPPAGAEQLKNSAGKYLDPGYVSDAQFAWLKDELDKFKDKANVFIFMHHPIKPKFAEDGLDKQCAKKFENLIANYDNIAYVLAGHEHLYFNPQAPDDLTQPSERKGQSQPPVYLVSGGGGAPLKKDASGFYHYLVFHVKGKQVQAELVRLGS